MRSLRQGMHRKETQSDLKVIEVKKVSKSLEQELLYSKPKTELGKKLREIRIKIVNSGETLFDWDELEREIADRRGDMWSKKDEKADLY